MDFINCNYCGRSIPEDSFECPWCSRSTGIYDDTIEGTVDYSNLFSIIESEMSKEYNLIETVAHKISRNIHSQIKNIKLCRLEIIKKNPPIEGKVDNSSFILETTS